MSKIYNKNQKSLLGFCAWCLTNRLIAWYGGFILEHKE
ncbi:MAG: hypothetical protein Rpha_2177 [Candidatus Ruthia sp. Apha_13_S6]|nr:hypothetical protein [Candidatus Ruthia sp. Apha_13_S6]